MVVGGGGWDTAACSKIQEFAERNNLPVGCSFRCQDYFDNNQLAQAYSLINAIPVSVEKYELMAEYYEKINKKNAAISLYKQ